MDEPMYIPEKRPVKSKQEETKEEAQTEEKEAQPFVSTPISFSFSPKPANSVKKQEVKPISGTLSSFFSCGVCCIAVFCLEPTKRIPRWYGLSENDPNLNCHFWSIHQYFFLLILLNHHEGFL